MIATATRQQVLVECAELARMKIAGILRVPETAVVPEFVPRGGKLSIKFTVDMNEAEGLTEEEVGEVIDVQTAQWVYNVDERLEGLSARRHGCWKAKEGAA